MTGSVFNIRKATKEDCREIFRLVNELAKYEKQPDAIKNNVKSLEENGFSNDNPWFQCLVVDDPLNSNGETPKLIAYVMYCLIYGSKVGKMFDLRGIYIVSEFRGHGLGKQLLSDVCKDAVKENVIEMKLSVLDWNPTSSFYKKFGMVNLTKTGGWQIHCIDTDGILRFANLAT